MAKNKQHQRKKRQGNAAASGGAAVGSTASGKAGKVADERSVQGTTPGEDLDDWEGGLASATGEAHEPACLSDTSPHAAKHEGLPTYIEQAQNAEPISQRGFAFELCRYRRCTCTAPSSLVQISAAYLLRLFCIGWTGLRACIQFCRTAVVLLTGRHSANLD